MISPLQGGLGAAVVLFALWQFERFSHDTTKARLMEVRLEVEAERHRADGLARSAERSATLATEQAVIADGLELELRALTARHAALTLDLDRLQREEHNHALTAPHRRGNAAARRRDRILCPFFPARGDCASPRADAGYTGANPERTGEQLGPERARDAGGDR